MFLKIFNNLIREDLPNKDILITIEKLKDLILGHVMFCDITEGLNSSVPRVF